MTSNAQTGFSAPKLVAIYGWLGLVPFLLPPVIGIVAPSLTGFAASTLIFYAALILSFLGGARWGLVIATDRPDAGTVSTSMLPTLIALILLGLPHLSPTWRMSGLAAALAVHWLWDIGSSDVPRWYRPLRSKLTIGAIIGLIAGAVLLHG